MRKDVTKLAERLSASSKISVAAIYDWLMEIGRTNSINPCKLMILSTAGMVWIDEENYLEAIV